jgi:hypothetical protein
LSWKLLLHGADDSVSARGTSSSFFRNSWFVGGLAAGCGTMVRPETPLLVIALGFVLLCRWRRRADWPKLFRAGALAAVGFVLPIVPWTARNAISLHEFQPLAARYAQSPGETVPTGLYAWTNTWLVRYRDVDPIIWTLGDQPVTMAIFPFSAFDSADERERVSALISQYNNTCCNFAPEWNAQFAELARERTAHYPFRTYVTVPFQRALTMWFTPRVEMMGYVGDLLPLRKNYEDDREDFLVTALLATIGIIYLAFAAGGITRIFSKHLLSSPQLWVVAFLIAFCAVRTAFLTRIEAPEPRYVLECFPVVYVFGALLWARQKD